MNPAGASGMLTPAELGLLARLDLVHRRARAGRYGGERRSPRSARSPEFADFRPYAAGDDFRQIDWKVYARLERLMLRLYVAEEEACLNVVVDASASMALGRPPKWSAVIRLAAALAAIGLDAMDRVTVGAPAGAFLPAQRGPAGTGRVWAFLEAIEPAGAIGPDDLVGLRWARPGVTVVISDFLVDGAVWEPALAALVARRQEPVLWQVLSPDEERPDLAGDLKLMDAETGRGREVTVTPGLRAEYARALASHRAGLARAVGTAGGRFLHSSSADGLEAMMLAGVGAGIVRRR